MYYTFLSKYEVLTNSDSWNNCTLMVPMHYVENMFTGISQRYVHISECDCGSDLKFNISNKYIASASSHTTIIF